MTETDSLARHWLRGARGRSHGLVDAPDEVRDFHAAFPGYVRTPLTEVPAAATDLDVGRVFVKDEADRLGLPAFKILGASWATARALAQRSGHVRLPASLDELCDRAAATPGIELITATDGNHGQAVARMAALLGVRGAGADLVAVPVGVGSLAQAAVVHYRRAGLARRPAVLSIEPDGAARMLRSVERGERVSVPTGVTIMSGLDCGTPSSLAWPVLYSGLDAAGSVSDDGARRRAPRPGQSRASRCRAASSWWLRGGGRWPCPSESITRPTR